MVKESTLAAIRRIPLDGWAPVWRMWTTAEKDTRATVRDAIKHGLIRKIGQYVTLTPEGRKAVCEKEVAPCRGNTTNRAADANS